MLLHCKFARSQARPSRVALPRPPAAAAAAGPEAHVRVQEEKADWLIYVTDAGQASHFQLAYASARKAGILPKDPKQPPRIDHVGFGLVLSADRKRIATRSAKKVTVAGLP